MWKAFQMTSTLLLCLKLHFKTNSQFLNLLQEVTKSIDRANRYIIMTRNKRKNCYRKTYIAMGPKLVRDLDNKKQNNK